MLLNFSGDCSWFIIHDRLELLGNIKRRFRRYVCHINYRRQIYSRIFCV